MSLSNQKLSSHPRNPDYWLDYAVFCVRMNDCETAVEAVREVLSLDFNHQMGLLVYGLLMTRLNNLTVAEMAFEILLTKYLNFIEGWMVLRFLYITIKNFEGLNVTFYKIKRLQQSKKYLIDKKKSFIQHEEIQPDVISALDDKQFTKDSKYGMTFFLEKQNLSDPLSWSAQLHTQDNINIETAVLMLRLGFLEYAGIALSEEMKTLLLSNSEHYYYYSAVCCYLLGCYTEAMFHLETFVKSYGKNNLVWELMGHCYYKLKDHAKAIACYEYVMESFNRRKDIHLIYLRMGNYYLQIKKYACAKQIFLTACKYSPSPKLWKGAGIACLRLEELEDAETALCESNYLNNRDPETWAYLALTNVALRRLELFKHCYSEAIKRNLNNQSLLEEIENCLLVNNMKSENKV